MVNVNQVEQMTWHNLFRLFHQFSLPKFLKGLEFNLNLSEKAFREDAQMQ